MCDECQPVEIHPYEYAELERECDQSRVYCGRVLAAAFQICHRETGRSFMDLSRHIGFAKTTVYRHVRGEPATPATMYGVIALLEQLRQQP